MAEFRQEQKQTQSQVFAPQLRQSLKILQAPAMELRNAILEELETNPTLEELTPDSPSLDEGRSDDDSQTSDSPEELEFKDDFQVLKELDQEWHDHFEDSQRSTSYSSEQANAHQHWIDSVSAEVSLQDHLLEQAKLSDASPEELKAIEFIIGNLDDSGFLTTTVDELAKQANLPQSTITSARKTIMHLDPMGIGATNTQECLLIQLLSLADHDPIAVSILKDHYSLLLRKRIPELSKALSVSREEILLALDEIASLDPAPGRRFSEDTNRTVTADVAITKEDDSWQVILNNEFIPRLRISRAYKDMIVQGNLTAKERDYIKDKIRSSKFIISAIEQRQSTLKRLCNTLLKMQIEFFEKGPTKLIPLTMNDVAQVLELHETTISRAISNKYLQTPHGLFPLKYFFTSGYVTDTGDSVSNTTIKDAIAKIIANEPPQKPLSDQKIADLLAESGTKVARRTVAKYREELNIPPTSLRRKY